MFRKLLQPIQNSQGIGLITAIFYINDDRQFTDNIDGSGNAPADF